MKKTFACIIASLAAAVGLQAANPYLPLWEHIPDVGALCL